MHGWSLRLTGASPLAWQVTPESIDLDGVRYHIIYDNYAFGLF